MNLVSAPARAERAIGLAPVAKKSPVPAVVLGGESNALAVVRSLGRAGVPLFVLNQPGAPVQHSRHGKWISLPPAKTAVDAWTDFLLGPQSEFLRGAVLLACCDPALDLLVRHRPALAEKFKLDLVNPETQKAMLNKLRTYEIAAAAGVATPRFWILRPGQDLQSLSGELPFPLIVKPSHTFVFRQHFGKKFVIAQNFEELRAAYQLVRDLGIEVMLVEFIPGPDSRLCSYYTYLDRRDRPLFHFTKRVIRRHPAIMGPGCHHVTDWNPEVRDAGLAFFRAARLRGLGNVEFKRDPRDGRLKLIECNARMTEATSLLVAAGLDLPLFIYNRLADQPAVAMHSYTRDLRLWYPVEDFHAFRQLHRAGELSWWQWLRSISRPHIYPLFHWSDPWPSVRKTGRLIRDAVQRRCRRCFGKSL